jgi:hypothetical protein
VALGGEVRYRWGYVSEGCFPIFTQRHVEPLVRGTKEGVFFAIGVFPSCFSIVIEKPGRIHPVY